MKYQLISSMIESCDQDSEGHLLVKFRSSGKTYRSAEPVPEAVVMGLVNAPSAGKYYNLNIRGQYGMREVV